MIFLFVWVLVLECTSNFKAVLKKKGEYSLNYLVFFFSLCKTAYGIWHLNPALPDVITNTVKFLLKCFESFKHDIDN